MNSAPPKIATSKRQRLLAIAGKALLACGFFLTPTRPCAAQYLPNVSGSPRSPIDIPQTNLTPIAPPSYGGSIAPSYSAPPSTAPTYSPPVSAAPNFGGSTFPPPSASLGTPLFDPYSTGTNPGTFSPALPGAPTVGSSAFPGWLPGATSTQGPGLFGGLFSAQPTSGFGPGNPGFSGSPYGTQAFPPEAYPSGSPNTLFPGGIFSGGSSLGSSGGAYNSYRLFQGPRFRYGWLSDGTGPDDLEMNDIETSLVFAFPNFLYSGQPVYVVPSFGLHLLDGPESSGGADLPPQLYDAFLDTGWQSDPNRLVGFDLGLRVGVFSDFDTANSDSLRILGKGLVTFRLTPFSTFKAGVYYLDRNRIKLLPAVGLLYQPTPFTRFDIFFPQPKLARYLTTLGTQDIWGYVAGDYGGGSWSITRTDGREDSIDINDLRLLVGAEWGRNDLIRNGRHTGFAEVGFVFDREVLYNNRSSDNFFPGSTFMLRFGIGY